jgi:predicted membrane protein
MLDEIYLETLSDILKGVGIFMIIAPVLLILFLTMFLSLRYPMIDLTQGGIVFAISFIPFIFIGLFLLTIGYMIGKKEIISEEEKRKKEIMEKFSKRLTEIKKERKKKLRT